MDEQAPWYDAYPKPQNQFPSTISRGDLLSRLQQGEKPGSNFLLIDLRRTDHTVSYFFPNQIQNSGG
jgi:arsenical-resistance protein 2